jgi:hypothetical protein
MKTAIIFCAYAFCEYAALLSAQTVPVDDFQISGVVVDHLTNRPLNHVLVEITGVGKNGGESAVVTESDGRFTFLHVPKGKYNLLAQKRGQQAQGFESDGGFSTAIVVDGQQKTQDIVFALKSDASIAGTLLGDDGEPVRNATASLLDEVVNDGEAQTVQVNTSVTNSSGQFHFGHLEAGKYYIAASGSPWYSQPGVPGNEFVYPLTFYGDTRDAETARSITLKEGEAVRVQIDLHATPSIRVRLASGRMGFSLFVQGPGGSQIPVTYSLGGTSSSKPVGNLYSFYSGGNIFSVPEGAEAASWEISNVAAGHYMLSTFGQSGQQEQSVQAVDLTDGGTLSFESTASTGTIRGRIVFDEGAKPVRNLELFLSDGGRGMMADVAADGTFKFDKISAGRADLTLGTPDLTIGSIEVKGARMIHDHLEIPSGAEAELTVHVQASTSLATVEGFAVHDRVGVPGAMVLLVPKDLGRVHLMRRDQSDLDGSFSLAGVQPGSYTLLAIDDGHELAYKDEKVIKPYLDGGVAITIPLKKNNKALEVPVQARKP